MAKQKGSGAKKNITKKTPPEKSTKEKRKVRQYKRCFDACSLIEGGLSVRKAMKAKRLSSKTFYEWVDNKPENEKQFVRACEDRQDELFEECLTIVDEMDDDKKIWGNAMIQRAKLRIQTRLDMLARMNPKKYSERHIIEGGDKPVEVVTIFKLPENGRE